MFYYCIRVPVCVFVKVSDRLCYREQRVFVNVCAFKGIACLFVYVVHKMLLSIYIRLW